jgi:integrase
MGSIPRPQDVVTPAPILDGKQFAAILATVSGREIHQVRDKAMILMFAESGIRRSELADLDISDVDVRARTVVIRRGKGGKRRVTGYGAQTAQALLRWQRLHPLLRAGLDDGPLFCVTTGKRLTVAAIGYMLRRRGKAAGVTGLRPHMLRHLWAHHCMAAGIQETQIQKLAGWSSGQQLLRYGAALAEQRALDAVRNIDIAANVIAS